MFFLQYGSRTPSGLFGLSSPLVAAAPQSIAPPHDQNSSHPHASATISKSTPARAHPHVPVTTPDVPDLPFTLDDSTKVFHLRAETVKRKITPFKTIDASSYNGSCPGPTIHDTQRARHPTLLQHALTQTTP